MLIDTFINAIFLYDDKMVITFNYKEGTKTITFYDLKAALDGKNMGSDLDCLTAPYRGKVRLCPDIFYGNKVIDSFVNNEQIAAHELSFAALLCSKTE